ncbi:BREX system P-loop protein BrxC [Paenibacillus chartarius]|uniref:BREX system P-loop protein BrxC n=1 Tax=Paenibacillus chartarius TaxID=747481 RepID=A0ABV6DIF3_9BACL
MKIAQIFKKDIFRNINGVVQAGQVDLDTIKNELDEYVMTEEGTYYLKTFYKNYLAVYNQPSTNIGVWISGFFGSGKSHFLKILSYLLDNKEVAGRRPVDYFTEKTSDIELLDMMHFAAAKPSDAILFNIDSKSSANSTDKERIVEVFLRVFNGHLGYSDTLWVAEIERQIDSEGKYEEFKREIEKCSGSPWEEIRVKFRLKQKVIIQSLVNIGIDEESARKLLDTGKESFEMTSEKLSQLIAEYCQARGPEYRLIFLVDEVGQYIGTDSALMLNLQTVVEDIGNRCRGQAWVFVTSQEKIESVTTLHSTTDFSKIQGRFATRINLSSSNTDEVIKRRILEKTDVAANSLEVRYDQEEQMIRNRLSFEPNSTQLRHAYRTSQEFVELYPFIPYQVELLKEVFNKIRTQGEGGAHLAHGERSLLKAFQEACQLNADEDITNLVTMAEFYPSIRNFLEGSITSTIAKAEDRARNHEGLEMFDVDVLKVLYMIKGIDVIKSTATNVATLLMPTVDTERSPLEYRVKESLSRLQQAMLIEQNADQTYTFLSDEEQEINREIRNESVNETAVREHLGKLFYERMYAKPKFDYNKNTSFSFNKRYDNYIHGQMTNPLTMQVYSVNISDAEASLEANSGRLVLCLDPELIAEAESAVRYVQQVQTYVRRKKGPNSTQNQIKIYEAKQSQITDFEKKAERLLERACDLAKFFIQGQERTFSGSFENKVNSAMEMLVRSTYSKLGYVNEPINLKDERNEWKRLAQDGLLLTTDGVQNQHAYDEIKMRMEEAFRLNENVPLKSLIEKYSTAPYGWNDRDIIGLLFALFSEGKVKFTYAREAFIPEHPQFFERFSKLQERDRILVIPVGEVDPKVRRDCLSIFRELFGRHQVGESYEEMAAAINETLKSVFQDPLDDIKERRKQSNDYPYPGDTEISRITTGVFRIIQILDAEEKVNQFIQAVDDFDEWLEELGRLNSFYKKKPIEYFDGAVALLRKYDRDFALMNSEEILGYRRRITDILSNPKPYSLIPQLPELKDQLTKAIDKYVLQKREEILNQVKVLETQNNSLLDYYRNNESVANMIRMQIAEHDQLKHRISIETSLLAMRALQQEISECSKKMNDEARRMEVEQKSREKEKYKEGNSKPLALREKKIKYISEKELYHFFFQKKTKIETLDELDEALRSLRETLMKQLQENTLHMTE